MKASCLIVSSSSFLRVIIGDIGHFSPHENNTKETRMCPVVQEGNPYIAVLLPLIRRNLQQDNIKMVSRCRRKQPI